jgi:dimethylaniline monooxygenase (N-oxide forming)
MSKIGGVWNYTDTESNSSVYKNTHINTKRDVNSFGDFPVPLNFPVMMHHTDMLKYFVKYSEHFGLARHVRFDTHVLEVNETSEKTFVVKFSSGGRVDEEAFDFVLICSGHHSNPRWPDIEGLDSFRGTKLHSHAYKDNAPFKGKKVVVVGIGNSGADIVTETSKVASECILVSRQGVWLLPNGGEVADTAPVQTRFDSNLYGMMSKDAFSSILEMGQAEMQKVVIESGLKPNFRLTQGHPTLTCNTPENNLFDQLKKKAITVKRGIARVLEHAVEFTDGTIVDCDVLICCTGYKVGYPFLSPALWGSKGSDSNEVSNLYKNMWPADREVHNIAWIGLVQPVNECPVIVLVLLSRLSMFVTSL